MKKTIVHTCSSVLVRPNGIVRYINAVMDLQRSMGHTTIFVTDSKPTQIINADTILYLNEVSTYTPNKKDGHVWLQMDPQLIHDMDKLYTQNKLKPDLVIAHDLHSYYSASTNFNDGIFVQHESDVLTPSGRYSFLDDDYLNLQKLIVTNTNWRIGLTVHSPYVHPKRPVYTPAPFTPVARTKRKPTKPLLYVGDTTDRKGAREFMEMARILGVTPTTVISHEEDAELFKGADVYSFGLDQQAEMFKLMSQHRVAYLPSKNECPGLAVLECLQFMPVVLDGQYQWTQYHKHTGALICEEAKIQQTLLNHLVNDVDYDRTLLEAYGVNTLQYWRNLLV